MGRVTGGAIPMSAVTRGSWAPASRRDPRAERKARGPERQIGVFRIQKIESRVKVVGFAGAVVELAFTGAHAPEVESKHHASDPDKALGALEYRLRMHGPALLGMRMREHDGRARGAAAGRRFDEVLQAAGDERRSDMGNHAIGIACGGSCKSGLLNAFKIVA